MRGSIVICTYIIHTIKLLPFHFNFTFSAHNRCFMSLSNNDFVVASCLITWCCLLNLPVSAIPFLHFMILKLLYARVRCKHFCIKEHTNDEAGISWFCGVQEIRWRKKKMKVNETFFTHHISIRIESVQIQKSHNKFFCNKFKVCDNVQKLICKCLWTIITMCLGNCSTFIMFTRCFQIDQLNNIHLILNA